ncbi:cubilin-like [Glandiceps talaboti]
MNMLESCGRFSATYGEGDYYEYLEGMEGRLQSPNFPNTYPRDLVCEWRIEVPEGRRIRLRFNVIDVYNDKNCHLNHYDQNEDMVVVRDGLSADSSIIARYCGNYAPDLISSGNVLFVSFYTSSRDNIDVSGFQAFYYALDPRSCDFALFIGMPPPYYNRYNKRHIGRVSSPGYPMTYAEHKDSECSWLISSRGQPIFLTFLDFDLPYSDECRDDYVEVYDGESDDEGIQSFGRFCGTSTSPGMVTKATSAFIKYKSSQNGDIYRGFMIKYIEGPHVYLNNTHGEILHQESGEKIYYIEVPDTYRIYIQFNVLPLTPKGSFSSNVYVYDGFKTETLLAAYQQTIFHPILSSGNTVRLRFDLDLATTSGTDRGGIQTTYRAVQTVKEILRAGSYVDKYITIAINKTQTIHEWVIYPYYGLNVVLEFQDFQLLSSENCSDEYLEIRSGPDDNSPLMDRLCGDSLPRSFTNNVIYIKYVPSTTSHKGNFTASCRTACEFNIVGLTNGVVQTPATTYSMSYRNQNGEKSSGCLYNITVPEGKRIVLRFDVFVEVEAWRNDEYLEITDLATGGSLGTYGKNIPTVIRSSDNRIQLRLSISFNPVSFSAEYMAENLDERPSCGIASGITYRENQGEIKSANYPIQYPRHQDCTWYIRTDKPASRILLTFQDFVLENGDAQGHCRNDFLEVHDGPSIASPLIGVYCGDEVPGLIVSTNRTMTIKFRSNGASQSRGFWILYEAKCYQMYDGPAGLIQVLERSPRSVVYDRDCTVAIKGSKDSALSLDFTSLELPYYRDINPYISPYDAYHYVDVYVDKMKTEHIVRYYGNNFAPTVTVPSNNVFFVYQVPDYFHGTPTTFNVTYSETDNRCRWPSGDLFFSEFGNIENPWENSSYPGNQLCTWRITNHCRLPVYVSVTSVHLQPVNGDGDGVAMSEQPGSNECTDFLRISSQDNQNGGNNKLCHLTDSKSFISNSDVMQIAFQSGPTGGIGSFNIEYDQGCGYVDIEDDPASDDTTFNVSPGAAPWMALLYDVNEGNYFCSGVLLNDNTVITTVECIGSWWRKPIIVRLGKTFTNFTEDNEVEFNTTHRECFSYDYSICVIKLDRKVKFNSFVRPLCLPTFEAYKKIRERPGKIGYSFGWGRDHEDSPPNTVLQRIPLRTMEWDTCLSNKDDNWYVERVREYHCAGYLDGNNGGTRCYGHSGGPFAKYHKGKWYMIGLVASSRHWDGGEECPRRGQYGWFWRTTKIDETIKGRVCD